MAELPDDFRVEMHVVNGEPEVFVDIEGSTFHLRPDEALALGEAIVARAKDAEKARQELDR